MGKLIVSRRVFDGVIGDHVHQNLGDDYEFLMQAYEQLEIRKELQVGEELDTLYIDFGGDLSSAREFAQMYSIPRKQIILARDWRQLEGRRVRVKPVNLDYFWSLLNWNHDIHRQARSVVYRHEAQYGSVDV
jgi:hypothetical protein